MRKKPCFIWTGSFIVAAAVCALSAYALDAEFISAFDAGNKYYEKGDYASAIKEYGKIIGRDTASGNLYYNIGNCYFKKGDIGHALLYYERAKRLMPQDADLRSNYEFALSQEKAQGQMAEKPLTAKALDILFGGLTIDGLAIYLSSAWGLLIFCLSVSIFSRGARRLMPYALAVIVIMALPAAAAFQDRLAGLERDAIITAKAVDAKFEPFDSATTYFQVNQGNLVREIDEKEGWRKIRRADGKLGWVKSDSLEKI